MELIKVKIDVTKISKKKLYQGEKGTYLNVTLIPKQTDYSDYMVVEETTKEEREAGEKGVILGNASILRKRNQEPEPNEQYNDDLPF